MRKVLEMQERRIKRKEGVEEMARLSRKKVKKIKEVQGNKYAHEDLEKNFELNVVLPEIAR